MEDIYSVGSMCTLLLFRYCVYLKALEVKLDVFNITVCRQLAENKVTTPYPQLDNENTGDQLEQ